MTMNDPRQLLVQNIDNAIANLNVRLSVLREIIHVIKLHEDNSDFCLTHIEMLNEISIEIGKRNAEVAELKNKRNDALSIYDKTYLAQGKMPWENPM